MKKVYASATEALDGVLKDGMLIAAGGFGLCGIPENLIRYSVGIENPEDLVADLDRVGREEPLSREKLTTVLGFYVCDGWEAGCDRSIAMCCVSRSHRLDSALRFTKPEVGKRLVDQLDGRRLDRFATSSTRPKPMTTAARIQSAIFPSIERERSPKAR